MIEYLNLFLDFAKCEIFKSLILDSIYCRIHVKTIKIFVWQFLSCITWNWFWAITCGISFLECKAFTLRMFVFHYFTMWMCGHIRWGQKIAWKLRTMLVLPSNFGRKSFNLPNLLKNNGFYFILIRQVWFHVIELKIENILDIQI